MPKTSREIRNAFLDFFAERGHERMASGPLVPANDPTLMFANAGMVPFKDVFTGKDIRPYKRATSSQKCIRISGKHNDLENVGVTARHHTFFEMLGNFSFGDYFKREAIQYAWTFFIDVLKLDPARMVVTVFGGEDGLAPADDEAAAIWKDVTGFPDERIIRCGAADNFWQMGDTGPCGPCSEIHYCLGTDEVDPRKFGEEPTPDGRGWFELWNLVFMQFDRQSDGRLVPLPAPSIDTGAGLERVCVVAQDVLSNYDTDLLRPVVDLASTISGKRYTASQGEDDVSMRVIADHARTTAFLISEGIFPDRVGRPYVLRRVMRRAIRHGHRLGIGEPFLHECALRVVEDMGDMYPQLRERRDLIADITRQEEERFRATLKRGLDLLDTNSDWAQVGGQKTLPGATVFKLYDTFGFPVDLQEVIGRENGFGIDQAGFDAEMAAAKKRSQGGKLNDSEAVSKVYHDVANTHGQTEFVGYAHEATKARVLALVNSGELASVLGTVDPAVIDALEESDAPPQAVVLDRTPFYAEKGGQVGDQGELRVGDAVFVVTDTRAPVDGLHVHVGYLKSGALKVGDEVEAALDVELRNATRRNHSATHLLHWALREVVGPTATQKGSLVGPYRLRFDFSATRPLTPGELGRIEDLVNGAVLANEAITTDELAMDAAKAAGAIGIFEEKYGDVVRMLRIGPSLELCGGTHARRTGDIGLFKILSESGLAAGVRRIEATTGLNALAHLRDLTGELDAAGALLKASPLLVADKVKKLMDGERELRREIERLKQQLMQGGAGDLSASARDMGGVNVLGAVVPLGDPKALRELADQLRDKLAPSVILLGSPTADGQKALLACSVSKDAIGRAKAGDVVKHAAAIVGGGGGGRPDFAQAGGSDPSKLDEAVASVFALMG
ncbi:MAG: alanine--tRNA ligase [Polyangiales bacterium]|nr:alanine--tRNA ligase [Sandaracinaceae bacterium]